MEFGHLDNVNDVDWTLPPADPLANEFLAKLHGPKNLQISFGAPAWAHREWVGSIYPVGAKPTEFIHHYARYFSCIELNTSHYRIPTPEQTAKWLSQVPANFLFCSKIYQGLSHERKGLLNQPLLQEWLRFVEALGSHRGPCFLQLPPYFDYSFKAELFTLLQRWPGHFPLAIEFRHPTWFQRGRVLPALTQYLQSRGIGLVITDVGGRRDVLHTSISAPFALLRFIGNNLHPSDFSRAQIWCERFVEWEAQGLQHLFLFIHEPDDVKTPEMTEFFLDQLREIGGWKLKPVQIKPAQLSLSAE